MAMSKKNKNRKKGPRKARMEGLETRTLMAADLVPAEVVDTMDYAEFNDDALLPVPPSGVVFIHGTDGDDAIKATVDGNRLLINVNGDIQHYRADEVDTIAVWAKDGNDRVMFNRSVTQNSVIVGGSGNDVLQGGSGHDYILGGAGRDSIRGGAGNDLLDGGADGDRISGGLGDDAILGGLGNDGLAGNAGDDAIAGGSGNDMIRGGSGVNWLFGDGTNSVPRDYQGLGHYARTYAHHNYGNDRIIGGDDTDLIFAGNGNDNVQTGDGVNLALGGRGNDVITGGEDRDFIFGGYGSDSLRGEGGDDGITGDPVDLSTGSPDITPVPFDFRVEIDGVRDANDLARDVDRVPLPTLEKVDQ